MALYFHVQQRMYSACALYICALPTLAACCHTAHLKAMLLLCDTGGAAAAVHAAFKKPHLDPSIHLEALSLTS